MGRLLQADSTLHLRRGRYIPRGIGAKNTPKPRHESATVLRPCTFADDQCYYPRAARH